jgi:peptidoglycan hydrolase CwlO-like protein
MFSANAKSWGAATVHYTMLKRLAKTNGDLEAGLAPVAQFFARRSPAVIAEEKAKKEARKAAKAAAAAPATPAAATTASAPAPAAPAATVTSAVSPASAPTATPTPSAPISPAHV